MTYKPYASEDYYMDQYEGSTIPEDELEKALKQASRHVDSLTYNRIVGRGFSNLTDLSAGDHQGSRVHAGGFRV